MICYDLRWYYSCEKDNVKQYLSTKYSTNTFCIYFLHYSTFPFCIVAYSFLLCRVVLWYPIYYHVIVYCILLFYFAEMVPYYILLCCIVLYCGMLCFSHHVSSNAIIFWFNFNIAISFVLFYFTVLFHGD